MTERRGLISFVRPPEDKRPDQESALTLGRPYELGAGPRLDSAG